jgi:hypothetical protein
MHKTGKPLFTWIPDWLMGRLQIRGQKIGNRIFAVGESTRLETSLTCGAARSIGFSNSRRLSSSKRRLPRGAAALDRQQPAQGELVAVGQVVVPG